MFSPKPGTYFIMASHLTGWAANPAMLFRARAEGPCKAKAWYISQVIQASTPPDQRAAIQCSATLLPVSGSVNWPASAHCPSSNLESLARDAWSCAAKQRPRTGDYLQQPGHLRAAV